MPTSGTTTYSLVTSQIINKALLLLGVVGEGESVPGETYTNCLDFLNLMVKDWETKSIYVFTETEGTLFLNLNQYSYVLGGANVTSGGTAAYASTGSSEIETQLTASYVATNTTFAVNSTTGMTALDYIGIVLDSGAIYWSTISSVPTSTSVIIAGSLPSAATSGNYLYTYTTQIGRPLELDNVRIRKSGGTDSVLQPYITDFKMNKLSRSAYLDQVNRGSLGTPIQWYLDRQSNTSVLYTFPTNNSIQNKIKFTYRRIIQDFTNPTDTADFPQEWLKAIIYNLAVEVAPIYGKEIKVSQQAAGMGSILQKAEKTLADAHAMAQEKSVLKLVPSIPYN